MGRSFIAISRSNAISVVQHDHTAGTTAITPLASTSTENDHHVAALAARTDGRIIAAYSEHVAPLSVRISTNPKDSTTWGAATVIDSAACTYPRLAYLSSETKFFLIYRQGDGTTRPQVMRTSTDSGATWSAATNLITETDKRPYLRLVTNGTNRIDFFVTDGHPRASETPDGNSLYHFYYSAGDWFNSGGTDIGDPPFTVADATQVYDGTTTRSWIWDAGYSSGSPVALFTTFVSDTDHRYRYARWSGSAWETYEIATAGKHIYETAGEEQYTAGGCFAQATTSVYLCREVATDRWELERWATSDGGETWTSAAAITSSSPSAPWKNYRPYKVEGGGPFDVVWLAGRYTTFLNWSSSLMASPAP